MDLEVIPDLTRSYIDAFNRLMPKLNEQGIAHIFLLLILLAGIAGGIFILKSPENLYNLFRPKAGPGVTVAFVDGSGNPVTSISSANARVKLTSPDWPTTQSIKKVSLVSEAYAQTSNVTYIDYKLGCGDKQGLTPDQMCQKKGFAKAVAVSGSNAAKGYWWRQCGGASVSACSGLNCTVNKLDCTNKAGYWGSQQPYRSNYMKGGTAQTVYKPTDLGLSCSGYNPGWTLRVACTSAQASPTYTPAPTPKTTSSCSACSADVDKDGLVNIYDFSALRVCFNKKVADAPNCKSADIDGNGTVNLQDFTCLSSQFGKTCTTTSPTPTPAPVTTVSATLAEDPNFTVNVKNVNVATSSAIVDYTFSSSTAGTKTLYAKFKSSDNREQNGSPFPATIQLVTTSVSGPISSTPTPTSAPTSFRVFVTSVTYNGNLGGASGADDRCQERANAASLGGTWKAWISSNTANAKDRIPDKEYVRTDGVVVANNKADLLDGTLDNPIDKSEGGDNPVSSGTAVEVFTGTDPNGVLRTASPIYTGVINYPCADWTEGTYRGAQAVIGGYASTNANWTDKTFMGGCDSLRRLYCFEVDKANSPTPSLPPSPTPNPTPSSMPIVEKRINLVTSSGAVGIYPSGSMTITRTYYDAQTKSTTIGLSGSIKQLKKNTPYTIALCYQDDNNSCTRVNSEFGSLFTMTADSIGSATFSGAKFSYYDYPEKPYKYIKIYTPELVNPPGCYSPASACLAGNYPTF